MKQSTLESIGINVGMDIPARVLFSSEIESYNINDKDKRKLKSLAAFMDEYYRELPVDTRTTIHDHKDASKVMKNLLLPLEYEECWIVTLNRANKVTGRYQISSGSSNATIIDMKAICKRALELNATGVLLYHNHPSGKSDPSNADIKKTEEIRKALDVFEISLLDHIIYSTEGYFSFSAEKKFAYSS